MIKYKNMVIIDIFFNFFEIFTKKHIFYEKNVEKCRLFVNLC